MCAMLAFQPNPVLHPRVSLNEYIIVVVFSIFCVLCGCMYLALFALCLIILLFCSLYSAHLISCCGALLTFGALWDVHCTALRAPWRRQRKRKKMWTLVCLLWGLSRTCDVSIAGLLPGGGGAWFVWWWSVCGGVSAVGLVVSA